jgi:hypothetical protein
MTNLYCNVSGTWSRQDLQPRRFPSGTEYSDSTSHSTSAVEPEYTVPPPMQSRDIFYSPWNTTVEDELIGWVNIYPLVNNEIAMMK